MKKVIDFPERASIEEQAAEWLIRLDGDDALSSEEREALRLWLARSPAHREQLYRLTELWSEMNALTELAVALDRHDRAGFGRWRWLTPTWVTAVAATILVAIGLTILFDERSPVDSNGLYATALGQQRLIALTDGSTVLLNTDSQIRANYSSEYRDVQLLRGEAHFSVASNSKVPFRVTAGSGRIRAVGTAFSVYMRDGAVDVTVNEGSVAVEMISAADGSLQAGGASEFPVIEQLGTITAGQVASILRVDDASGQTQILDNLGSIEGPEMSRRLAWTEGMLIFSGEPLEEVVREISRYTAARIEFSDPSVGAIRVGGRFPVGETETMFETLEETFGLRVIQLSDNHVLVSAGD